MNYDKDAPADLQATWHHHVANMLFNKSILDVGAGRGKSKERLSINENRVTTMDVNRNLMQEVDYVKPIQLFVESSYDVVTAFDVIEHIPDDEVENWILNLRRVAERNVFVTTPNSHRYPHPWHFTPEQFFHLFNRQLWADVKFFLRFKIGETDEVRQVFDHQFLQDETSHAMGLMGII